jgi:hypothetical protein
VLRGNQAAAGGSAVYAVTPSTLVELVRTQVVGNGVFEGTTDFRGGAIHAKTGAVRVIDSLVADNTGQFTSAGIQVMGSSTTLLVERTTIRDNTARSGVGIDVRSSATASVVDSTIGPGNVGTERRRGHPCRRCPRDAHELHGHR